MTINIIHQKPANNKTYSYLRVYLNAGFNVIPLQPKSKVPNYEILEERNGSKAWKCLIEKPLLKDELKTISKNNPNINYGIITGKTSKGLVILDIDGTINDELMELLLKYPTLTVKTSRGNHYWFKSKKQIENMVFDFGELRAKNQYALVPPSIHPTGLKYEFVNECECSPLPDELFLFLKTAKKSQKKADTRNRKNNKDNTFGESVTRKGIKNSPFLLQTDDHREFFKSEHVAFKIIDLCGEKVKGIGKAFSCVLPGPFHEGDKHPSAALYKRNDGIITYYDFHSQEFWLLPEVYAAFKTKELENGQPIHLKDGEILIWGLRALHEMNEIKTVKINSEALPDDVSISVKRLYEGFIYLLELRQLYSANQIGTPFSWRFARGWCGIGSMTTISKSMDWLLKNDYIVKVKEGVKHGKQSAALYNLS